MRSLPWLLLVIASSFSLPLSAKMIGIGVLLNPEGSRLFPQTIIYPRHPGKPDPRWKSFDWHYVDIGEKGREKAVNYRLYFYEDEEWILQYAIPEIRRQIEELGILFQYTPPEPFSYLLFNSLREFRQANIFNISEGVQGVTSTTEATMAIPYWGQDEAFRHVSTHELVHQFQVQKTQTLAGGGSSLLVFSLLPLWFVEGMAEHYSLGGVDAETRGFIRDLFLYPDLKHEYTMPKFMEPGPLSFIHVYKLGQVRIDFLETTFGKGISQKLLEAAAKKLGSAQPDFASLLLDELKQTPEQIEEKWQKYLNQTIRAEAEKLTQSPDDLETVTQIGENLDLYDVSPDESLIATREINPLSGVTSIQLQSAREPHWKIEVAKDQQPNLLSLYFFQLPTLHLSDSKIIYIAETTSGPEIEWREIQRPSAKEPELGPPQRINLHKQGIIQAHSPALSPDQSQIAFVGLTPQGWENIYIVDLFKSDAPHPLTRGYYSWQTLSWDSQGILGASNRTATRKYNLFRMDPVSKKTDFLTTADFDQFSPTADPKTQENSFYFQSWESGSSQIHFYSEGKTQQSTSGKTGLTRPVARREAIYALGFKSGRYHLYRIPKNRLISTPKTIAATTEALKTPPWQPELEFVPQAGVKRYQPFTSSRPRIDQVAGYFASGNIFGVGATVSDLMRDYSVTGEFSILGDISLTTLYLFLSSQRGRFTWHTGGYHLVQSRMDNVLAPDDRVRTYLHREFGVLGAFQYPLTAFSYLDVELRAGGVKRSQFSDPELTPQWEAQNPGVEFMLAPMLRLGYDRVLYETFTGPLRGYGILLESDTTYFPGRGAFAERLRLDVASYFQLFGSTVLALQGVGGASWGEKFGNPFFVSSDDLFRAYSFADDRLRGNFLLAAKSELRFPIGSLFGFPPLRGLIGADGGTLFRRLDLATQSLSTSATAGLSFNFPPIAMNLMLSYPLRTAPGPVDRPLLHFTLRYLYL